MLTGTLPMNATPRDGALAGAMLPCFEAIAPEWDALADAAGASPYLRPGWFAAWWRAFGEGELLLVTLRRGGRLAALLPLVRHRETLTSATNCHTPQFGILAESDEARRELLRQVLATSPQRVTITSLDPEDGSVEDCAATAAKAGYRVLVRTHQRSPYIPLRQGAVAVAGPRPDRRFLARLGTAERGLAFQGALSVEVADGRRGLDELLAEAFTVEASGWKGLDGTAIHSRPTTRSFYGDVARWAAERGLLRLFFLRVEGRAVATFFALEEHGVCYLLKGGHDPAERRWSPGHQLLRAVVTRARARGAARIELHGDDEPYKLRWTDRVRERRQVDAFAASTRGMVSFARETRVRPLTRTLRDVVRGRLRTGAARDQRTHLVVSGPALREAVGRYEIDVHHRLASHPLLDLEAVACLADLLPPHAVEQHDAKQPLLVPGGAKELPGVASESVRNIATNGRWLVLWNIEQITPYRRLLDEILDEAELFLPSREGGMGRREAFLFLSAPGCITPAHFDPENNLLLQVHGTKEITIGRFPDRAAALRELDRYHDGGHRNLEEIPPASSRHVMRPGEGVYIYPFAPHWVANGQAWSMSLSITFRTRRSQDEELVHILNGRLRRYGLRPRPAGDSLPVDVAKARLLAAARWVNRRGRRQRGARDAS